jgi:hypothetical protein
VVSFSYARERINLSLYLCAARMRFAVSPPNSLDGEDEDGDDGDADEGSLLFLGSGVLSSTAVHRECRKKN